ncbi:hypothetical protein BCR36DRAFT_20181 [Piromyces finnis]|uniref:Uncharacterized protein n=1 Tax=Piromyces finnis TaxID=1754191 RepID=A0A1Y1VDX9_9FUNG|nr:hypothetical protein BCR36DRAFT_20181 [Piromyces finnis]|eukprot:ORX53739.1 hypothetical protein BCR36DRAFT_20181 [Piromyces finnis]
MDNISENDITNMKNDYIKIKNMYIEKYGTNDIDDAESDLNLLDAQSKLGKENLIKSVEKLVKLVNKDKSISLGVKYNEGKISSEIDHKTIVFNSENLVDSIKKLTEQINSLDLSNLSSSELEELEGIDSDLRKLNEANKVEIFFNDKPVLNSEITNYLHNSLRIKLGKINRDEVSNVDLNPDNNNLRVPEFERLENTNIIDLIKDDFISSDNKKYIFKGLETSIKKSTEPVLDENLLNIINEIKSLIESKGEQTRLNDVQTQLEQNSINLIYLIGDYNDLIDTINQSKELPSESDVFLNKIEMKSDLINNIKITSRNNENIVEIVDKVAKKIPTDSSNLIQITYDKLSLLILVAGNVDGTLVKTINEEGKEELMKINVMNNGEKVELTIKDIIPSLRGLEGKELDNKYKTLYSLSQIAFLEYFSNSMDENGQFNIDPTELLNNHNILNLLINQNKDTPFEEKNYYLCNEY